MSTVALVCYIASVCTWHTVTYRSNDQSKWQMPKKLAETEFVCTRERERFTRREKRKREKGEGRDMLINMHQILHQPRNVTRIPDANYTETSQG